jgi:hypothetical protein
LSFLPRIIKIKSIIPIEIEGIAEFEIKKPIIISIIGLNTKLKTIPVIIKLRINSKINNAIKNMGSNSNIGKIIPNISITNLTKKLVNSNPNINIKILKIMSACIGLNQAKIISTIPIKSFLNPTN